MGSSLPLQNARIPCSAKCQMTVGVESARNGSLIETDKAEAQCVGLLTRSRWSGTLLTQSEPRYFQMNRGALAAGSERTNADRKMLMSIAKPIATCHRSPELVCSRWGCVLLGVSWHKAEPQPGERSSAVVCRLLTNKRSSSHAAVSLSAKVAAGCFDIVKLAR